MGRRSLTLRLVAMAAGCALVAAACGGSKGTKASNTTTSEATATTEAPTTTSTAIGDQTAAATTSTTAGSSSVTAAGSKTTTTKKASTSTKVTTAPPAAPQTRVQVTAPPDTTASAEQPQPGGTLTEMELFEANSLDPIFGNTDGSAFFAVFDNLLIIDPAAGVVSPEIADSMTSADAITWTLHLRPNVKFSDGTPFDANAVKYNWDRIADPANNSSAAATVKSFTYTPVDAQTLKLVLNKANGQFPRIIAALGWIGSPTAIQKQGANDFASHPVGAGPMILKSWVRGSAYTFERNPTYWNAPRPYLDRFILKPILDDSQRSNSLKAGEADLIYMSTPQVVQELQSSFSVYAAPSLATSIFTFQMAKAPFNDPNARKAIQLAVDIPALTKTVYGDVEPPTSLFPGNSPFNDVSGKYPSVDLATAQQLVNTWSAANGGKDLEFTITYANNATSIQAMQLIQQNVQRLQHVKMNLNQGSVNQLITALVTRNFEAITYSFQGSDPEGTQSFNGVVESTSTSNFESYKNSTVDAAIADSRVTLDVNQRLNDYKTVQKQIVSDVPFFPWNRFPTFWIFKPTVKNVEKQTWDATPMVDRIWIKTH